MIALEVSSAAGRTAHGGIPRAIRNLVEALLRIDPGSRYHLCYRFSRWRKGQLFRPDAPNVRVGVIQDPFNAALMWGDRLIHSMGIFVPRTPRIPKLLTVHDLNAVRNVQWVSPRWHKRRSARIREAVSRADHVITYSAFTAQEVREEYGLPEDRVHPVLLGVDSEAFTPPSERGIAETRQRYGDYVLAVGVLSPRKNFARLVEAVAPLKELRLILVGRHGDGGAEVMEAAERHGMCERMIRLEGLDHRELVALLGAAQVFAVPSLYEGFGLTVLEAMACGTPVVCSRSASLPEVSGEAAHTIEATSVEELSQGLRRCTEDSAFRAELRARGLTQARSLSWEASARKLRALYRDISGC